VFYSAAMVVDAETFSPSARKPRPVMASWETLGIPIEVHEPDPVTQEDLLLVHDRDYVRGVLAGTITNGFGNSALDIPQSSLWTTGAMLSAARTAIANGQVAVAPCCGFHHACFDHGGGYCTFNGLMITVRKLMKERLGQRFGILDFDQHWGDGTHDIIRHLDLGKQVVHYHPGHYGAKRFLDDIPKLMDRFDGCDIVLYQAGADPHIKDPLGGWLTTPQIKKRDRLVFETLRNKRIPVAWNLAGGYQYDDAGSIRPILEIHDNTMLACASVYAGYKRRRFVRG
jgi:acetoin utilization deacetylase AcuC-like enzyme